MTKKPAEAALLPIGFKSKHPIAWGDCLCGGKFGLAGYDDNAETPLCYHTVPYCERYNAINTVADAASFSQQNRERSRVSASTNS